VTTYIQSGNVVFRVKGRGVATLASRIEKAIEAKCGFRPRPVHRSDGFFELASRRRF